MPWRVKRTPRNFGAFVEPDGVALMEYRRAGEGVEVMRHWMVADKFVDVADAAAKLAELVTAAGGPGSTVGVVVRGFGVAYEILALPPAEDSVVRQVVTRELARLHPDVPDPITEFAAAGLLERRHAARAEPGVPQREVLAGIAPREVVTELTAAISEAGAQLRHVTVSARAAVKLFEELDASEEATALVIALPTGPIIAFFHEGALRFAIEPPVHQSPDPAGDASLIADQINRGSTYLRQQFRGTDVSRVLLSAERERYEQMADTLSRSLAVGVEPLGLRLGPPVALAALGGVLDAEEEAGLNLYPLDAELAVATQKRRRSGAVWAAIATGVLIGVWSLTELLGGVQAAQGLERKRRDATGAVQQTEPIRGIVTERQANAARLEALSAVTMARRAPAQMLRIIERYAGSDVELSGITMARTAAAWDVRISGVASGVTNAAALARVSRYYRDISFALDVVSMTPEKVEYLGDDGSGAKFVIFAQMRGVRQP